MSDLTAPAGGAEAIAPPPSPPASDTIYSDAHAAGRALAEARWKRDNPEKTVEVAAPEEAAADPPQESEANAADDAAPPQEAPGETQEADPVEIPPVDPPRSWTKDEKEAFRLLPPDLQKSVAELERNREVEIRRGQNEAAEQRKAAEAARQQAETLRLQYEAAIPQLQQAIKEAKAGEFADIQSQADVERLANEDWPRFARWQAHQMKMDAIERESRQAQERQQSEYKARWNEFATKEDAKAAEHVPELADKAKSEQIAKAVAAIGAKHGLSSKDIMAAWNGDAVLPLRHSAMQEVIAKAALYDLAKANAKPAPKAVPPVHRPGVSKAPTSASDAEIQNLRKAFERKPTPHNAAALRTAMRRASA